jgi:hypothetical protein
MGFNPFTQHASQKSMHTKQAIKHGNYHPSLTLTAIKLSE